MTILAGYEGTKSLVNAQGGHVPKPLAALVALAGGVILFRIRTEELVLGWLFLAPLFQESASATRVGHLLALAFYTVPPLVFALKAVFTRGWRPRLTWIDVSPALYVLLVLGSLLITSMSTFSASPLGTTRNLYQTVALGPLVYYVLVCWPGRSVSAQRICAVVLAAASIQAAMAIIEWPTHWNLWHDTGWQRGGGDDRSVATLANPGLTGAFIGVGVIVGLAVLCWDGPVRLRGLSKLILVLGPFGLLTTLTRGPVLATILACIPIVVLARRSRFVGLWGLALAGLMIFAFWGRIASTTVYQNRVNNSQNVDIRLALQEVSLRLAAEKPILGWGYGSFDQVKSNVLLVGTIGSVSAESAVQNDTSHDSFLTVLVEYGGVGLLLLLLPWLWICARALRRIRARAPGRWLEVAGVGAVFVVAFNGATLDYRFFSFVPMVLWLFLGLMRRADLVSRVTPAA
jgi:O-antigen ligase